ncbi:hypothetical protein [Cupriavidus sp. IK-TO18]|uniref:hypothetical protein n=1 Tax=Cupriavidus sp. IK-TO18 TaxID=2782182 RepID=UPI00189BBBA5|nr:hypothetical protein [Cupriavidus sp. IK-TO18]MBF6987241.1 hypothetical protein [Cupriavidus sp. IK-TO18]
MYAKSRIINARGPYSADKLEEVMYAQLKPSMERTIGDTTTDAATRNGMSVAEACQELVASAEEAAQELDLSRVNPGLYEALTHAQ